MKALSERKLRPGEGKTKVAFLSFSSGTDVSFSDDFEPLLTNHIGTTGTPKVTHSLFDFNI